MQDAPSLDDYADRNRAVCGRAEALETTTDRRLREYAVAEAVAGPEAESNDILVADGGETPGEDEPLHVGDQVSVERRSATTAVVRVCEESAGTYQVEKIDESVAEYNGCDPNEDVYQVVFPDRDDSDLADNTRYPYPRSMLSLEGPVHDRDDQEDDNNEEWIEDDNGNRIPERSEPADFGGGESTGVQDL